MNNPLLAAFRKYVGSSSSDDVATASIENPDATTTAVRTSPIKDKFYELSNVDPVSFEKYRSAVINHETGNAEDPYSTVQKVNRDGGVVADGPGKGAYQFEGPSLITAAKKAYGISKDPIYKDIIDGNITDATQLSPDVQDDLFFAHNMKRRYNQDSGEFTYYTPDSFSNVDYDDVDQVSELWHKEHNKSGRSDVLKNMKRDTARLYNDFGSEDAVIPKYRLGGFARAAVMSEYRRLRSMDEFNDMSDDVLMSMAENNASASINPGAVRSASGVVGGVSNLALNTLGEEEISSEGAGLLGGLGAAGQAFSSGAGPLASLGLGLGAGVLNYFKDKQAEEQRLFSDELTARLDGYNIDVTNDGIGLASEGGTPEDIENRSDANTSSLAQLEQGEVITDASSRIFKAKANKPHKEMGKDEATDRLNGDFYIHPIKVKTRKKDADLVVGYSPAIYNEDGKNYKFHQVLLGDEVGEDPEPIADKVKRLKTRYKVSKDASRIGYLMELTNSENIAHRTPFINKLKAINEEKLGNIDEVDNPNFKIPQYEKGGKAQIPQFSEGGDAIKERYRQKYGESYDLEMIEEGGFVIVYGKFKNQAGAMKEIAREQVRKPTAEASSIDSINPGLSSESRNPVLDAELATTTPRTSANRGYLNRRKRVNRRFDDRTDEAVLDIDRQITRDSEDLRLDLLGNFDQSDALITDSMDQLENREIEQTNLRDNDLESLDYLRDLQQRRLAATGVVRGLGIALQDERELPKVIKPFRQEGISPREIKAQSDELVSSSLRVAKELQDNPNVNSDRLEAALVSRVIDAAGDVRSKGQIYNTEVNAKNDERVNIAANSNAASIVAAENIESTRKNQKIDAAANLFTNVASTANRIDVTTEMQKNATNKTFVENINELTAQRNELSLLLAENQISRAEFKREYEALTEQIKQEEINNERAKLQAKRERALENVN